MTSICAVCRLRASDCICERLPKVEVPARFTIVRHHYEKHRQSNTGALAHSVLPNSCLVGFGDPGVTVDAEALGGERRDVFVLCPIEGSSTLDTDTVSDPSETNLIVLDASWRQARRMSRRIEGLRALPFLRLPPLEPSSWQLRRPSAPEMLTTIDAIAAAVEILGYADEAQQLRAAHELFARSIRKHWARYPNPGPRF